VQHDQHNIHQNRCQDRLQNSNGNSLRADGLQLAQTELIANGKRNESQSHLGQDMETFHLLQRIKAQTWNTKGADHKGTKKQTRNQIGRYSRKPDELCQAREHQTADHGNSQTNQRQFHKITFFNRNCATLGGACVSYSRPQESARENTPKVSIFLRAFFVRFRL